MTEDPTRRSWPCKWGSYVALFRLESGATDPRLGTLRKLARALNVTVADLIGEGKPARRRAGRR